MIGDDRYLKIDKIRQELFAMNDNRFAVYPKEQYSL